MSGAYVWFNALVYICHCVCVSSSCFTRTVNVHEARDSGVRNPFWSYSNQVYTVIHETSNHLDFPSIAKSVSLWKLSVYNCVKQRLCMSQCVCVCLCLQMRILLFLLIWLFHHCRDSLIFHHQHHTTVAIAEHSPSPLYWAYMKELIRLYASTIAFAALSTSMWTVLCNCHRTAFPHPQKLRLTETYKQSLHTE